MTMIKKLNLGLCALALTAGVITSAGAFPYGAKATQHGGFYVELEPFHARLNDGFLQNYPFADVFISSSISSTTPPFTITNSSDEAFYTFDPNNHWGFRVALGYDFPSCNCCTYGFSLEYIHFNNDDDHQRLSNIVDGEGIPALSPYAREVSTNNIAVSNFDNVDAVLEYKYDTLDLLGHKNFTVCGCVDVQLFSGARYLRYEGETNYHYTRDYDLEPTTFLPEAIGTGDYVQHFDNDFHGIGPRVGLSSFYQVCNGFGLIAEVAGDLIFGESKNHYHERIVAEERRFIGVVPFDNFFTGEFENRHHRESHNVPGLSGKVGIAYRAMYCNCSSLVIEVGYRGDKYFNLGEVSSLVQSVLDENSKAHYYHDVDLQGPYFTVAYHF